MNETSQRRGPAVDPVEVKQLGDCELTIAWADGARCRYRASELRRACPCAQCVNEWTGERVLKPASIPEELTIEDVSIVGRYALNFRWSDGHDSGIYSFRLMREFCETRIAGTIEEGVQSD